MLLANIALNQVEKRLPNVIDARTHGVIDYLHAIFFLGMALACRKRQPRAAVAALATGGLLLTEALLTDYPLGAKKMIPFAVHGRFDAAIVAASLAIPKVMGFEGTAAALVFKANSAVEGTVVIVRAEDWQHKRQN